MAEFSSQPWMYEIVKPSIETTHQLMQDSHPQYVITNSVMICVKDQVLV